MKSFANTKLNIARGGLPVVVVVITEGSHVGQMTW
jgi:hypothetical protein